MEYIDEQFKKLEKNRQEVFDSLIKYLQASDIGFAANGESAGGINSVEIRLPNGKSYSLWAEVVKREKDYANFFQTSELISIPDNYPRFGLANISVLGIWNDLANDSDFLTEVTLPTGSSFGRTTLKLRKEIQNFAVDYIYALKQVANHSLEKMYNIDTLMSFLTMEGYSNSNSATIVRWERLNSPEIYVPIMYGRYFSGKQIKAMIGDLFEKFEQFVK